jgi:hypothetical protein
MEHMGKTGNELDENDDGSSFFSLSLSRSFSLDVSFCSCPAGGRWGFDIYDLCV